MRAAESDTQTYKAKAPPDDVDAYKARVAEPMMAAIDNMPAAYRDLVHEFNYVDVYRAWRAGWSVAQIRARAKDGIFELCPTKPHLP